MHFSRFAAALTLAAVIGTSLTVLPTAPAVADDAATPASVPLDGSSVPALAGTEQGIALLAARENVGLDPAHTVFTATAGEEAHTKLLVDTAGLPGATHLAGLVLTRGTTDLPQGVEANDSGVWIASEAVDGTRTPWGEGEGESKELSVTTDGAAALVWNFERPGTYTVEVHGSVTLTTEAHEVVPAETGADTDVSADPEEQVADEGTQAAASTLDPIGVQARYVIEVAAADQAAPEADVDTETGAEIAAESTESVATETDAGGQAAAEHNAAAASAAAPAVISDGDVRIANRIENGLLVQGLSLIGADGAATALDLATTVLAVPTREAWPGAASEYPASWDKAVPSHGDVYRTRVGELGANRLSLSIDSSAIATDAVLGDPIWGDGGIFSRLGAVTGEGAVSLMAAGEDFAGSNSAASRWLETSAPGGIFSAPELPFALVFDQPGRVCVSIETMVQANADGTVLNNDLTLTLAVGDIDPATVEPCAQPAAIAPAAPQPVAAADDGVKVIDSGRVRIAATLDEKLALGVVTVDRGRATAHDAQNVVISVPHQDTRWPGYDATDPGWNIVAPAGTRLWRTLGTGTGSDGIERANDLVLALEAGYIDASRLDPENASVSYRLSSVATPEDGYVATYITSSSDGITDIENTAAWDSRSGGRRAPLASAAADRNAGKPFATTKPSSDDGVVGFAFSADGVYCLGIESSTRLADGSTTSDTQTLTFAVGIDPSTVTPCETGGETDPTDPVDPTDPGTGELDPTVTWFDHGHLDLKARVDDDGRFSLASIGDAYGGTPVSLDDTVWVANSRFTKFTVPEPDGLQDLTFLGDPGHTYYGFSQSSIFVNSALWPGINTQGLPSAYYDRVFTWTVTAVSGPGALSVYSGNNKATAVEYFDSRHLPGSFTIGNSHVHENWSFTEAGVYCIDVNVTARRTGQSTNEVASGRLTVAVGDIDLSSVQPCGRSGAAAPITEQPARTLDTAKTVIAGGVTGRSTRVELSLANGTFDVAASTSTDMGSAHRLVDVERVVWSYGKSGDTWHHMQQWSALPIPVAALQGDIAVTLGEVTGPGDYYVDETRINNSSTPTLDTRAGRELREETVFPERRTRMNQQFTAAGVYCLPYTWSATAADGTPISVTKVLTVAAGVDDPASVQLCADGGHGTDPGEGTDPVSTVEWDVRNHTLTNSGATIITDGHVDLASKIDDGMLRTTVKDDSDALTGPIYRDPSQVVLQLRPASESSVPSASAFRFLGAAGSPVWQVEQVQQDGLLWPGWSSELIASGAITGGVQWTLRSARGPGEFALYETDLGSPTVRFNTRDGITSADSFTIAQRVHAHGTWAFSAEGVYCLAFERAATLASGAVSVSDFTVAFAVGRVDVKNVDPRSCPSAPTGEPIVPGADTSTPAGAAVPASVAVPATQCVAGATILSSGHIDFASRIVDGRLRSLVGDDSSGTKVYREPDGVVLWLKPSARLQLPSGYGQIGAAGTTVWQVPQTQNSDLIWLGWNTEALNAANAASPVRWSLDAVDGPGAVTVYTSGSFGGVQQVVLAGSGSSYSIPLGVHAHANWAFSAEGIYRLRMTQTATLANGASSSDTQTLTIAVGAVDPASATAGSAAGCGAAVDAALAGNTTAAAAAAAPDAATSAGGAITRVAPTRDSSPRSFADPLGALAEGDPVPLLTLILGALLLAAAFFGGAAWGRRRRGLAAPIAGSSAASPPPDAS